MRACPPPLRMQTSYRALLYVNALCLFGLVRRSIWVENLLGTGGCCVALGVPVMEQLIGWIDRTPRRLFVALAAHSLIFFSVLFLIVFRSIP